MRTSPIFIKEMKTLLRQNTPGPGDFISTVFLALKEEKIPILEKTEKEKNSFPFMSSNQHYLVIDA